MYMNIAFSGFGFTMIYFILLPLRIQVKFLSNYQWPLKKEKEKYKYVYETSKLQL